MSDEHKESGCCGGSEPKNTSSCGGGCCCKTKKLIIGLLIVGLAFAAGMMFAKSCPLGQTMCPISGK